jgi:ribonuclease H / adenosylcobalamin/alpha-ribazole phosphatase
MTTILLVRHGMCDPVGRLIAGRMPGVRLNAQGLHQSRVLGRALAHLPIAAVYSSPLERALETAEPLARTLGMGVRRAPGLVELDFGEWTGRSLAELESDPRWTDWNERRATARIPDGESMAEVIARAAAWVDEIRRAHTGSLVVAFSHGDVIRALLTHYLDRPIDQMLRLEVAPGSVSEIEIAEGVPRVRRIGAEASPEV